MTMMNDVSPNPPIEENSTPKCNTPESCSLNESCIFLCEYAARLLGSGATCIRVEKNVNRIARALGYQVVMTILPRHVHMTVCTPDHSDSYTYISSPGNSPISFEVNTRLSELSWEISDGRIPFRKARRRMEDIVASSHAIPALPLLVGLANASFCRLFGGDVFAMGAVFAATIAGFYLKQLLAGRRINVLLIFIICSFVSSVLAAGAGLFHLGETPQTAIATSVLYLVPGIPFLNSFSDLLAGHYICAFSRFINATVLTCCLSIGLCGGMVMMHTGMF